MTRSNLRPPAPEDKLLTLNEAAEYFGVIPQTMRRWVDDGRIAGTRTLGGHRRVYLHSVLTALEEHEVARRQP
jgi:excisionase family DNA binding protein